MVISSNMSTLKSKVLKIWIISYKSSRYSWTCGFSTPFSKLNRDTETSNGRDLRDHHIMNPLPWTETPSTKPSCSNHHQCVLECVQEWGMHNFWSPVQCLSALWIKNFFLIANWNLPSFILKLLSLALSLHILTKSPFPTLLYLLGTGRCCQVSPEPFLFWQVL